MGNIGALHTVCNANRRANVRSVRGCFGGGPLPSVTFAPSDSCNVYFTRGNVLRLRIDALLGGTAALDRFRTNETIGTIPSVTCMVLSSSSCSRRALVHLTSTDSNSFRFGCAVSNLVVVDHNGTTRTYRPSGNCGTTTTLISLVSGICAAGRANSVYSFVSCTVGGRAGNESLNLGVDSTISNSLAMGLDDIGVRKRATGTIFSVHCPIAIDMGEILGRFGGITGVDSLGIAILGRRRPLCTSGSDGLMGLLSSTCRDMANRGTRLCSANNKACTEVLKNGNITFNPTFGGSSIHVRGTSRDVSGRGFFGRTRVYLRTVCEVFASKRWYISL